MCISRLQQIELARRVETTGSGGSGGRVVGSGSSRTLLLFVFCLSVPPDLEGARGFARCRNRVLGAAGGEMLDDKMPRDVRGKRV